MNTSLTDAARWTSRCRCRRCGPTGSIRGFCTYVTDGRYGWAEFCERVFDDVPSQVVFEWDSPRHSTDDAVPAGRRAFTKPELQAFFDAAHTSLRTHPYEVLLVPHQHVALPVCWLEAGQ